MTATFIIYAHGISITLTKFMFWKRDWGVAKCVSTIFACSQNNADTVLHGQPNLKFLVNDRRSKEFHQDNNIN